MSRFLLSLLTVSILATGTVAQEPISIDVKFVPTKSPDETTVIRLLPADTQLRDGNAAVVMLRVIWEQNNFMQKVLPKFAEWRELEYDDPAIAKNLSFDRFQQTLKRAAYIRNADWDYPIGEVPTAEILLPDVQGLRQLVGYGMSLWIGTRIADGDLDAALEGVLIQLSCARHLARTPFLVNQLVANVIAQEGLGRVELLITQTECPNLYWALALLPESLGDKGACLQFEAALLPGSEESLSGNLPPTGDVRWKQLYDEFSSLMAGFQPGPVSAEEATARRAQLLDAAQSDLLEKMSFTPDEIGAMTVEERVMRWVLWTSQRFNTLTERAFTLPAPLAIARLSNLEDELKQLDERLQPKVFQTPLLLNSRPLSTYLSLHRFNRHVKQLQTVESIRDYAARNDGKLPKTLDDLDLPAPRDPMTLQPFVYEVDGDTATLSTPMIEGVKVDIQSQRTYKLSVNR